MKIYNRLKQENGVALLMIMTSTALLALMLGNFLFETKVNQLRVYNGQDRIQARLNAEAGLNFALAKLKLYQMGRNILEKNDSMKDLIDPRQLEVLLIQEFMAPVNEALLKDANLIIKDAVTKFNKSIIIDGTVAVSMSPVSGFLNPNNMRIKPKSQNGQNPDDDDENEGQAQGGDSDKDPPHVYVEKELTKALQEAMTREREKNEEFDLLYGNLEPSLLIKELKYYVIHPDNFTEVERGEIEANYNEDQTIPKHAPMTSLSELYLLKGWSDDIVNLVKDRMTVHEVAYIQINEITKNQLTILFPELTDEQLQEFFDYRDGNSEKDVDPHPFRNVNDFKSALTTELGFVDAGAYDERIKEFESAGIKMGVAGKLYKIKSRGEFGRSSYTLEAFVDLPVLPEPKVVSGSGSGQQTNPESSGQDQTTNPEGQVKKQPLELMEPRVIEIRTL